MSPSLNISLALGLASALAILPIALAHGDGGQDDQADAAPLDCYVRDDSNFKMSLHIGGIFIILVASSLGVFGALLLTRLQDTPHWVQQALTFGRNFGTGVILAVGFIHMLPSATEAFSDPCVASFASVYSSWVMLFALLAGLAMHLIEFIAGEVAEKHMHDRPVVIGHAHAHAHGPATVVPEQMHDAPPRANSGDLSLEEAACKAQEAGMPVHHHMGHSCHDPTAFLSSDRKRISTYILEFGIASHSVLIGLTLGVTGDDGYVTLLIAIVFHQFFEGIALGSRIGEVIERHRVAKLAIMAAIFALTTPVGMAVGVGIRTSYAPRSPTALITSGVLDSVSAGILLYTGFVSMLAEDFNHSPAFLKLGRGAKIASFGAVYLGVAAMAIIGKWA